MQNNDSDFDLAVQLSLNCQDSLQLNYENENDKLLKEIRIESTSHATIEINNTKQNNDLDCELAIRLQSQLIYQESLHPYYYDENDELYEEVLSGRTLHDEQNGDDSIENDHAIALQLQEILNEEILDENIKTNNRQDEQQNINNIVENNHIIYEALNENINDMTNVQEKWLEKAIVDGHINFLEHNKFTNPMMVNTYLDKEIINDFINELKLLRKVCYHPNIITFYGVTKDNNGSYNMVLQYANDGNLREYLRANFTRLQWNEKLLIAKNIALGLLFLHDNDIIHRDLHSKNILIHQKQPKIADFGLSKQINETSITSNSIVHGMPAYVEPQCFFRQGYQRDKRSDIYSIGANKLLNALDHINTYAEPAKIILKIKNVSVWNLSYNDEMEFKQVNLQDHMLDS
ncbi:kinase-like protein [Gigaspora margarita]|uniref:non-specific serine/threonine protein kinase n=1 Tax=Gigaspora margarita TaxID=4874 RepID=A0A8H3X9X2_GIGMA|nr:kinase-like protein [Gigaspora margarita]